MRSGTDGSDVLTSGLNDMLASDGAPSACGCSESRTARLRLERSRARLKVALKRRARLEQFLSGELAQDLVGIAMLTTASRHPSLNSEQVASHLERIAELLLLTAAKCGAGVRSNRAESRSQGRAYAHKA